MSNNAYLSDQRVYFDEAKPTVYFGYTLSTSGSMDNLEWFKSEGSRTLFEACVAKSSLEYGVAPTASGIRMAAAYLLLTAIGEVEFMDDFLECEEILLADVRWSELLNAIENLSQLQRLMPEEEKVRTLLLQYTDETIEWVSFEQQIRAKIKYHKELGRPHGNSIIPYDTDQCRSLDLVGDIAMEEPEQLTLNKLVNDGSFVRVTGRGISQIFTTTSMRMTLDEILTELEQIRQAAKLPSVEVSSKLIQQFTCTHCGFIRKLPLEEFAGMNSEIDCANCNSRAFGLVKRELVPE